MQQIIMPTSQDNYKGCMSEMMHIKSLVWVSLIVQLEKNLPAMWEAWVRSLSWEDPLEKEMATHSSILAWKTPRTEEPDSIQTMGSQKSRTRLRD